MEVFLHNMTADKDKPIGCFQKSSVGLMGFIGFFGGKGIFENVDYEPLGLHGESEMRKEYNYLVTIDNALPRCYDLSPLMDARYLRSNLQSVERAVSAEPVNKAVKQSYHTLDNLVQEDKSVTRPVCEATLQPVRDSLETEINSIEWPHDDATEFGMGAVLGCMMAGAFYWWTEKYVFD